MYLCMYAFVSVYSHVIDTDCVLGYSLCTMAVAVCMYVRMHVCICRVCAPTRTRTRTNTKHTHLRTITHTHTNVHTRTRTYTHKYTHIYSSLNRLQACKIHTKDTKQPSHALYAYAYVVCAHEMHTSVQSWYKVTPSAQTSAFSGALHML